MAVIAPENLKRVELLGLFVHRLTMDETLAAIERFIAEERPHHIVTLDASMCVTAASDPELSKIVRGAELVTPDSVGVLWACKRSGQPLPERVSGVEIVERLCALSARKEYRLYFLGAAPGVADEAANVMRARYPGCRIVGTHDGYFTPDTEVALVQEIRATRPDVLCVALGIPKQEKWIACHRATLNVQVLIGVGGSFDVHAGRVQRAPRWMQRMSLEWLYRLARNPRKIGKVSTLPRFVIRTLRSGRRRK